MIALPVTSTIAAILALVMIPLSIQVSARRAITGMRAGAPNSVVFGDGGNEILRNAIRAFGNFTEYVPMVLLMLALAEAQGAPPTLIAWVGGIFAAGRVLHAAAMTWLPMNPAPRGLAMFATYAALGVPAVWLLLH